MRISKTIFVEKPIFIHAVLEKWINVLDQLSYNLFVNNKHLNTQLLHIKTLLLLLRSTTTDIILQISDVMREFIHRH